MGYRAHCEETENAGRILIEMAAGKVWTGRAPAGQSLKVVCRTGSLWVTGEDGADHILGPGQCYRTSEPALVVVEALEDSTVQVATAGKEGMSWLAILKGMRIIPSPA